MVNRVWQHHFGRGIVATPSNFGTRGSPPTHPELLDWLTASFIEHGWSIKSLHRVIMAVEDLSARLDADAADEAIDPSNRWYWRFDRQRLDAEAIRDAMLDVSGHARSCPAGAASVSADPRMALDAALSVQGGLPVEASQRVPDDAAPAPPSVPGTVRRSRHEHDDRRAVHARPCPLQALFLMNSDFMRDTAGAFAAATVPRSGAIRRANSPGCTSWRTADLPTPDEIDAGPRLRRRLCARSVPTPA